MDEIALVQPLPFLLQQKWDTLIASLHQPPPPVPSMHTQPHPTQGQVLPLLPVMVSCIYLPPWVQYIGPFFGVPHHDLASFLL